MKPVSFSKHATEQMADRGADVAEVEAAIRSGEPVPAKKGRLAYRKNFPFDRTWKGKYYAIKQVLPIAIEEVDRIVIVTVYVFYFGAEA